ncbi:hypothetical protein J1N35_039292 [Gossypium stocksii]|uniref:Uncharacterized protein n=1 Tax=Gossypium stocksii TaxID=47602 RepID=A0A9D3UNH3_9ROSI|nr:hypothetical protein J1N35_039292 [Gossypium stocksii]
MKLSLVLVHNLNGFARMWMKILKNHDILKVVIAAKVDDERFALDVSNNYVKKALGKKWRDHKSTLKNEYFKKNISLEEKLQNAPPGMLRYQWKDAVRFWNSKK